MNIFKTGKFLSTLISLAVFGVVLGIACIGTVVIYFSQDLPDHNQLSKYNPPTVTRLYASNGQMLAEYAEEKRLYVPITAIPKRLVNAFIAAEDKNFYSHPGIDITSIMRAAVTNFMNYGKNRTLAGGSTITQQVVKNFLLSSEKSLNRKIKEAILAFRITQTFSKDRIMELYLNEIYLGNRSFGVAAAALNYFNKSIGELTIEEAALLAALPKAPSRLDPNRYLERAIERRNWVIGRMEDESYITHEEASIALTKPIELAEKKSTTLINASFFTDTVKQELTDRYSEDAVYKDGMAVRTTLDPMLQKYAEEALIKGVIDYDRRHGWQEPINHISLNSDDWHDRFKSLPPLQEVKQWSLALVTNVTPQSASILLQDDQIGTIPIKYIKWARIHIDKDTLGPKINSAMQVLHPGNVVAVQFITQSENNDNIYALKQIPKLNGSIVAMDPHTGKVLAMSGGYNYQASQFNRAVQAQRQPGSAFKPFVYLAAMENGFTPNSIIVDEAVQLDQGGDQQQWRPQNHSQQYYGTTTLRTGVEKSRNVMTVRLAQLMGIGNVVEIGKRFNIHRDPPRNFAMALGSSETTLLNLTTAYAMLVNGGKYIQPYLVERIQDRNGLSIYQRDHRPCLNCQIIESEGHSGDSAPFINPLTPPILVDQREQIVDPITSYQIVSILEGVIQRGTGRRARSLKRTLAGKTGTTNDSFDAWFLGFTPDLVVGVYAGFDQPQSLGKHEYGSSVALPIWIDFMTNALKGKPDIPFRRPEGVKLVKIDVKTGLLPSPGTNKHDIIFEAFKTGTEPTSTTQIISETGNDDRNGDSFLPDLDSGSVY